MDVNTCAALHQENGELCDRRRAIADRLAQRAGEILAQQFVDQDDARLLGEMLIELAESYRLLNDAWRDAAYHGNNFALMRAVLWERVDRAEPN